MASTSATTCTASRRKITKDGAKLAREPGVFVPHRDRRTKSKKYQELDDDLTYTANQLDRDVVAENQIRLVIRTFKDKLPEIFPGRTEVPKTLVFAKTDLHAEDIVRIIREEFGKGNDFCQKITSKTHRQEARRPARPSSATRYNPRIAVTVDMIATGTDVKPLECLLFMRNIRSLSYFEQMKGRGCRVIDPDALQSVTPDAKHKTHFVIVDAVGVCEDDKIDHEAARPQALRAARQDSQPRGRRCGRRRSGFDAGRTAGPTGAGGRPDQEAANRAGLPAARDLAALSGELLRSIDPDANARLAIRPFAIPPARIGR